jgi:hypothetical protein
MSRGAVIASWSCRLVAAVLMGQTLFFKFTGAPEARALFEALGAEPWGRIGTGVLELVAVLLLLVPRTAALGGLLGVGLMVGALGAHATELGVEVEGDGGLLFGMALAVLAASAGVVWLHRASLPRIGRSR